MLFLLLDRLGTPFVLLLFQAMDTVLQLLLLGLGGLQLFLQLLLELAR